MTSRSAKEAAETEEKIDMTPMIDVTFLLLIFFIVTIKFKSLDAKIQVEMPTSFGSQNTGEVEKPKIAIDVDVVEPGMARFRAAGANRKQQTLDWLHPIHFLQPPTIIHYLRGTQLATREAELAQARRPYGSKPPKIARTTGVNWDFDKWGKKYKDLVFTGPITANGLLPYDASKRCPLRLLRYKIREQEPGNVDRPVAVCFSIEELQRLMSELWWKYYKREISAQLRDSSGQAPNPDNPNDKERFDEYKRKSPALVIKAGESTVLAWTIARKGTPTPFRTDRRRTLVYKPKFASYWLAEPTFIRDGSPLAVEFTNNPRQVAPYYDSMGWNVQYEDITEILDMLNDNIFTQSEVRRKDAQWSPGGWVKDRKHYFGNVFLEQTFVGDSSVGFIPDKFTNQRLYRYDYEPSTKLRKPAAR